MNDTDFDADFEDSSTSDQSGEDTLDNSWDDANVEDFFSESKPAKIKAGQSDPESLPGKANSGRKVRVADSQPAETESDEDNDFTDLAKDPNDVKPVKSEDKTRGMRARIDQLTKKYRSAEREYKVRDAQKDTAIKFLQEELQRYQSMVNEDPVALENRYLKKSAEFERFAAELPSKIEAELAAVEEEEAINRDAQRIFSRMQSVVSQYAGKIELDELKSEMRKDLRLSPEEAAKRFISRRAQAYGAPSTVKRAPPATAAPNGSLSTRPAKNDPYAGESGRRRLIEEIWNEEFGKM